MKSMIFKKYIFMFMMISSINSIHLICAENNENNNESTHATDEQREPSRTLTEAERKKMYHLINTSPILKLSKSSWFGNNTDLLEERRRWESTTDLSDEEITDKMIGKRAFLLSIAATTAFFNPGLLLSYVAAYQGLVMTYKLRTGQIFSLFSNKPLLSDKEPVFSLLDAMPTSLIQSLYKLQKTKQFQQDFARNPEKAEADLEKNIIAHRLGYTALDYAPWVYSFYKFFQNFINSPYGQEVWEEFKTPRATAEPIYPEGIAEVVPANASIASHVPMADSSTVTEMPMTASAPVGDSFWQQVNLSGEAGDPVHLAKPVSEVPPVVWPHIVNDAQVFESLPEYVVDLAHINSYRNMIDLDTSSLNLPNAQ